MFVRTVFKFSHGQKGCVCKKILIGFLTEGAALSHASATTGWLAEDLVASAENHSLCLGREEMMMRKEYRRESGGGKRV